MILIMSSGLSYANSGISNAVMVVLLSLITVGYALICLYTSQEFQLKVAKLLTILFALLMAFVVVGVAAQAGDDLYERAHPTTSSPAPTTHTGTPWHNRSSLLAASDVTTPSTMPTSSSSLADKLPADVSSFYLGGLIGIFILAALLHFTEAACLIHGIWYLLCLPSGYLLLIVYSICNMTDRSWGKKNLCIILLLFCTMYSKSNFKHMNEYAFVLIPHTLIHITPQEIARCRSFIRRVTGFNFSKISW